MEKSESTSAWAKNVIDTNAQSCAKLHVQRDAHYAVVRVDGQKHFEELREVIRRGINTREDAPLWVKELSETMDYGRPLQGIIDETDPN